MDVDRFAEVLEGAKIVTSNSYTLDAAARAAGADAISLGTVGDDPVTIRDVSTFDDPNHYSIGVSHVFVNGKRVVADGVITEERPGRPLRGPGYRR